MIFLSVLTDEWFRSLDQSDRRLYLNNCMPCSAFDFLYIGTLVLILSVSCLFGHAACVLQQPNERLERSADFCAARRCPLPTARGRMLSFSSSESKARFSSAGVDHPAATTSRLRTREYRMVTTGMAWHGFTVIKTA